MNDPFYFQIGAEVAGIKVLGHCEFLDGKELRPMYWVGRISSLDIPERKNFGFVDTADLERIAREGGDPLDEQHCPPPLRPPC